MAYVRDSAEFKKVVEKDRVFEFLAELNVDLDEVRGTILSKDLLPFTREVFSEVRREESRRLVMMGQKSHSLANENFTLNATTIENSSLNITATEVVAMSNKKSANQP